MPFQEYFNPHPKLVMPANINSTFLIHKQVVNPLIREKKVDIPWLFIDSKKQGENKPNREREKMKKTEQGQDNKLSPFNKP